MYALSSFTPTFVHPAPSVAVVILNWNGKKYLEQFLPSVLATTYPNVQVYVVDNASTDDSVAFVRERFPVNVIEHPINLGFAKGYNVALQDICADYYVLLNSDVEVTPGWIDPMIEWMEKYTAIGACQPKLLSYHQKDQFEYAGACGGWLDQFGYPFAKGRVFDTCEKDHGQYDEATPCFWASGAALLVRAKIFHQLGGLDPYFFAHQEEIDFCWRVQRSGYKVYAVPQSVVYHVGGGTLPQGNPRKTYLNFRNNLIMLAKNLPFSQSCWKIPLRFALDALSAYKELLAGNPGYYWAIVRAHLGFVRWLFFAPSPISNALPKKVALTGWYKGAVAWDYFKQKKRYFSEIIVSK